ncbi:COMM domain-containing protein 8 [Anabrus simplex]|uniref:COMM domain-containing protein 8 n=1 Tax=Anabrus simplex TaxID=316456 RepID=UPI0035A2E8A1
METDFQKRLQSLESQVLLELLHACVDAICGRKAQNFNVFKSSAKLEKEDYDATCSKLKELLILAVARNLEDEQILQQVPELDVDHQQRILECLEVRRNDISRVLRQKSAAISGPVLLDFDWKVKYVMGSSKLSSLREPLLSVDLHVAEEKGPEKTESTISLELNKTELSTLISALEKAQENIKNLKS